jgi:hypothetical protein
MNLRYRKPHGSVRLLRVRETFGTVLTLGADGCGETDVLLANPGVVNDPAPNTPESLRV